MTLIFGIKILAPLISYSILVMRIGTPILPAESGILENGDGRRELSLLMSF